MSTDREQRVAPGHDHDPDHDHDRHGDDDHHHAHDHGHGHAPPKDFGTAFAIGTLLNLAIVALQVVYGLIAHSTALLADAGHNLSDVLALVVAWGAAWLAKRPATTHFTYGWRGSSILAALLNSSLLLVVMGGIGWEAILRLSHPVAVHGATVIAVAAVGIVVNGVSAWLFASGRHGDINVRAAFQHMLSDALISFGVVLAGVAIALTGRRWIDPVATLAIAAVIVYGTWGLLRHSVRMALAGVPVGIDPAAVRAYLAGLPEVSRIHDLHIWPMSTTETALTCHLVTPAGHPGDRFTLAIARELRHRFSIDHTTLQIEVTEDSACQLADAHC